MATYSLVFDSINRMADAAIPHIENGDYTELSKKWAGAANSREVRDLAVNGWAEEEVAAMEIANSVIETVAADVDMPSFHPYWDVAGGAVDVGRYLAGEPENMIDYMPVATPRAGRVITLCASVSVSGAVSAEGIKRRGYAVAALAFALSRMGFAIEIWADLSATLRGHKTHMRTLVKGANDDLDPALLMFALAHPAMLRGLGLPAMHEYSAFSVYEIASDGYGQPLDPAEDLPEGTIYLPSVMSDYDIPKPEDFLLGHLRLLGIIE